MEKYVFVLLAGAAAAAFLLVRHRRKGVREFRLLLDSAYAEIGELLDSGRYFSAAEIRGIREKYSVTVEKLKTMKSPLSPKDSESAEKLEILYDLEKAFRNANLKYIESEKRQYAEFFSSFDDSQAEAIIRAEDRMLVLAGAGSGKTKTIEGLVRYLIGCKNVDPAEILLISFTRATVADLNARDLKGARARTFHNIGLDITKKSFPEDRPVSVYPDDKRKIIKEFLQVPSGDPEFLQELTDYYLYDMVPPEKEGEDDKYEFYENRDVIKKGFLSYKSILMSDGIYSITGQRFKSREEARIANFLFLHGIRFEYERKYIHQVNDGIHNAYRPDFYLPDYDIWLEHFGITRKNEVPFTRGQPDAAIQEKKYIDGMKWKYDTHRKYGTKLITTCSYHFTEETIFTRLEEQLKAHGVELGDPDPAELQAVFDKVSRTQEQQIDSFISLLSTFITQFKSTGKSDNPAGFSSLHSLNSKNPPYRKERTEKFLNIAEKVYGYYQAKLDEMQMIDYEDMINISCRILDSESGRRNLKNSYGSFKYVIIDEYQDISARRMHLAARICELSGAKLFCVGDDWQSIYRFTGSDLTNILNFGYDFPDHMQLALANTYRNSRQLTDAASMFIQQNPSQIKKKIQSSKSCKTPIHVVMTCGDQFPYLMEILGELYASDPESSVYILGRYNSDLNNIVHRLSDKESGLNCRIRRDSQQNPESVQIRGFEGMTLTYP